MDILKGDPFYGGLSDREAVAEAIIHTASRAGFHGRWETLSETPRIIADLGHNPAALEENFSQLGNMMDEGGFDRLIILYAVMADKDLDGILPLLPMEATYVFPGLDSARALPAADLASRFKAFRESAGLPSEAFTAASTEEAIAKAKTLAGDGNPLIFIGGSTYLISEAVPLLNEAGLSRGF